MATIRQATEADVPALTALGQKFLAWSPYGSLGDDPAELEHAIREVIATGFAMVAEADGVVFGALLGVLTAPWTNRKKLLAAERAWWVEPEHRGGTAAVRLLRAFQIWGEANGADGFVLSDLVIDGETPAGELFHRLGFRLVERAHYCEAI